jgi:phosphatidylglycerol:prolipoprotein diacylglycerol transferase
VHKIAFQFGGLTIYWYGILVALGFLAGFWTASRRAPREGISPEKISDLGMWLLVGAIVGARLLHVISYWRQEFAAKPWTEIFMVQHGGLVFYGGFMGSSLATIIYSRVKKLPLWKLADVLAPSIPLGHAFGRFGCLMTGCCYGIPSTVPWAIRFPEDHETKGVPVHPTQIYEALLNFALYGFLAWLFRRKRFDGQIFAVYLLGYAILRSIVESFRGDYRPAEYTGALSPGQVISIFIFIAGIGLWFVMRRVPSAAPARR